MPICPITLEPIPERGPRYSAKGLHLLSRTLNDLAPLDLSADQQIKEAAARAEKMSIQGVQPKLSAVLRVKDGRFEVVDTGGRFILKPCPPVYAEVPANESLTMTLASLSGIETPDHGLVYATDGSLTYWVRRFDRAGRNQRLPQEDFSQLMGKSRETKYESSMEQVVATINKLCTFPAVEKRKLALVTLFCFLTGNEDMHLKNFSMITRTTKRSQVVELSPSYDLLNTTIVLQNPPEEIALPIRGKKRNLTRNDLVRYFCGERCALPPKVVDGMLSKFSKVLPIWHELLDRSFLSEGSREAYWHLVRDRAARLEL